MALTIEALAEAGGFSDSLTEDQDLTARLVLAGHRGEWLNHVKGAGPETDPAQGGDAAAGPVDGGKALRPAHPFRGAASTP
jgi:hypothetical protein